MARLQQYYTCTGLTYATPVGVGGGGAPFSPICATCMECRSHPFFECGVFKNIWAAPPFDPSIADALSNFANGLHFIEVNTDSLGVTLAAVVCWRIWFLQNQLVHDKREGWTEDIIECSSHFLTSYRAAQLPQMPNSGALA